MFEWAIHLNAVRVNNIWADTYMEAELQARIMYGHTCQLSVAEIRHEVAEAKEEQPRTVRQYLRLER